MLLAKYRSEPPKTVDDLSPLALARKLFVVQSESGGYRVDGKTWRIWLDDSGISEVVGEPLMLEMDKTVAYLAHVGD